MATHFSETEIVRGGAVSYGSASAELGEPISPDAAARVSVPSALMLFGATGIAVVDRDADASARSCCAWPCVCDCCDSYKGASAHIGGGNKNDDDASGCCCFRPIWFASFDLQQRARAKCRPHCCGWTIADVSLLVGGAPAAAAHERVTFEGRACCAIQHRDSACWCCEPEVAVRDAVTKRFIGTSVMRVPCGRGDNNDCCCCCCGACCTAVPLTQVFDSAGAAKFSRMERLCCPWRGDAELPSPARPVWAQRSACGENRFDFPIFAEPRSAAAAPVAHLSMRFTPSAMCCFPVSFGFAPGDAGVRADARLSGDDQKLLVAMAISRFWRFQERAANNRGIGH